MLSRTLIKDTPNKIGETVLIQGWVQTKRDMGKIIFLEIFERSGLLQVVCLRQDLGDEFSKLDDIKEQYVLEIEGVVQAREGNQINKNQEFGHIELVAKKINIMARADTLPFDINEEVSMDVYLDHLNITLRTEKARAIFKVQSEIVQAFRDFMRSRDFVEFQAPKLVAGSTEGGANVFEVDYFGKSAFLAQSPQFYKQMMVGVFERVFTIGNVYRAERHATTRHLNEYTSLDFEFGFIKDHTDVMRMENDLLIYMIEHLKNTCHREFDLLKAEFPIVPENIPSLRLREAQEILKKEYNEDCIGEPDLEPHQEIQICEYIKKEYNSDFVFITHYPVEKRPMYTYPDEEDPTLTKSFDLLFRGVEITTGGQRINDYQQLYDNIKKWNCDPEDFKFYLEAFKYGMPPEGGLAIGLERITAKFLGINNVKKATLFPRDLNRIDLKLSDM